MMAILLLLQFLGWMQLGWSHSLCRCDHFSAAGAAENLRPESGCCATPAPQKTAPMPAHHQPPAAPVETDSCCDDVSDAPPAEPADCCSGNPSYVNADLNELPQRFCAASCRTIEIQQVSLSYVPSSPPLDIPVSAVPATVAPGANSHLERALYSRHLFSLSEHSPPIYLLNLALLI